MSEEEVVPESTPDTEQVIEEEVKSEEEASQPQDENSESSTEEEPKSAEEAVAEALKEESGEEAPKEESAEKAEEPEKAEEIEEPDDLYTEPEGLKEKGKQRFQDLVADNKDKADKLSQAQQAVSEIQTTIKNTGMNADELGFVFDYGKLAVSSDRNSQQTALEMAKNEVKRLSTQLGIEQEGLDLLEGHPDLQKRVEDYDINREDALEIRNYRTEKSSNAKEQERQVALQNEATQAQANEEASLNQVTAFMDSMQKTDIDYKAKEAILMKQVDAIRSNYQPQQWPAAVKQLYDTCGLLSSKQTMDKKTAAQPISTKNVEPGNQVPTTAVDAVKLALQGG
jgi:hypothetical protein